MACRDDGRVVFMVKGGTAEVNEAHCGIIYPPLIALLNGDKNLIVQRFKGLNVTAGLM